MRVLVDTCVWSLSLRRNEVCQTEIINELKELIMDSRVEIIGPIRQELLSGIPNKEKFEILKEQLRAFLDLEIVTHDYEYAAEIFNTARSKGIQGSIIDFLICAVAIHHQLAIFTIDKDFYHYQKYLPIKLHEIS